MNQQTQLEYIIALGPESSGKTTLINQLGDALGYAVRSEYARVYLDNLERPYNQGDLKVISEFQDQMSQMIESMPILCDTDALTLKIWQDYSFPDAEDLITPLIRKYDMAKRLYLLLEPDLPWVSDPQREHPELIDRQIIFDETLKLLAKYNCSYVIINGVGKQRLKMALKSLY